MGRDGIYYRKSLASEKNIRDNSPNDAIDDIPCSDSRQPTMEAITSGSVTRMINSSSAALLSEIKEKRNRIPLWPFALVVTGAVAFLLLVYGAYAWVTVTALILLLTGSYLVYQRDLLKKSVVIMYDLENESADIYESFLREIASLAGCAGTWHILSKGTIDDPKYHAGAGQVVNRTRARITEASPPYIRTNVPVYRIPLGSKSLFVFPDRLLLFSPNGVGSISYDELHLNVRESQFVEDGWVPSDAKVVDHTWEYVNKDGGPDRRFKSNRQLPVCLYENIRMTSKSGLNELLQASRTGHGTRLEQKLKSLSSAINSATFTDQQRYLQALKEEETRGEKTSLPQPFKPPTVDELYNALFDALCCVMVSDGTASPSEKALIGELMGKVKAPWTPAYIDGRISGFFEHLEAAGYDQVISNVSSRLPRFKQAGRQDVLLRCLDLLAKTDGRLDARENELINVFRDALA